MVNFSKVKNALSISNLCLDQHIKPEIRKLKIEWLIKVTYLSMHYNKK